MLRNALVLAGALVLLASEAARALTVTLVEFTPVGGDAQITVVTTTAGSRDVGGVELVLQPDSIPFSDSHRAAIGNAVSETSYSFTDLALQVTITEHSHSFRGAAATSRGAIYFVVDEEVVYSIGGAYSFRSSADAHEVQLGTTLTDLTTGAVLFDNFQWSSTQDEVFHLGEARGNRVDENRLAGSLAGALLAGTVYRWSYGASSWNLAPSASSGAGSGFVTLTFAPEPTSALLVSIGLAIGAVGRRPLRRLRGGRAPLKDIAPC